ncbi:hypothetical protein BKA70DRAFT_1316502 [Coprinopsis sp. MPI-PUGE-AT-0042]|nr:hypothetical protein BKA70DRAFT_1316502 [Coprinopsis sp. MPI-PUGE-AT-0042]
MTYCGRWGLQAISPSIPPQPRRSVSSHSLQPNQNSDQHLYRMILIAPITDSTRPTLARTRSCLTFPFTQTNLADPSFRRTIRALMRLGITRCNMTHDWMISRRCLADRVSVRWEVRQMRMVMLACLGRAYLPCWLGPLGTIMLKCCRKTLLWKVYLCMTCQAGERISARIRGLHILRICKPWDLVSNFVCVWRLKSSLHRSLRARC